MRNTILALTVLAGGSAALADTVTMNFTGMTAGKTVSIHQAGGIQSGVNAGQLGFNVTARSGPTAPGLGALRTFCVDAYQFVSSPGTYTVDILENAPVGGAASPMGSDKADAIRRMYSYAVNTSQDFSDSNFAAAFQIAVWEIIADFDSSESGGGLDVSSGAGDFYVTSGFAGLSTELTALFSAANSYSLDSRIIVRALTGSGLQDQMYMVVVPLPGSAGLAAVGLAGLGLVVRRRR